MKAIAVSRATTTGYRGAPKAFFISAVSLAKPCGQSQPEEAARAASGCPPHAVAGEEPTADPSAGKRDSGAYGAHESSRSREAAGKGAYHVAQEGDRFTAIASLDGIERGHGIGRPVRALARARIDPGVLLRRSQHLEAALPELEPLLP
jgi:hypothetical protein